MWGEVLDLIQKDPNKYAHVIDRVVGQVWDSAADISELCIGTPRAVFPHNAMMQKVLEKYMEYVYSIKQFGEKVQELSCSLIWDGFIWLQLFMHSGIGHRNFMRIAVVHVRDSAHSYAYFSSHTL